MPFAVTLDQGDSSLHALDVGDWTLGVTCSDRDGRAQVQIWGYLTKPGPASTLQWTGIRTHSAEGDFITSGGTDIDTNARGLESRWAPADRWAGVGLGRVRRRAPSAFTWSPTTAAPAPAGARSRGRRSLPRDVARGAGPGTCTVAGTAIAPA